MVKEFLIHAILIVYENVYEIYKQNVQGSWDDWDIVKKYQVHLRRQTGQNVTDTDTRENICLIQPCINHGYYKMFSKGQEITAIHQSLQL